MHKLSRLILTKVPDKVDCLLENSNCGKKGGWKSEHLPHMSLCNKCVKITSPEKYFIKVDFHPHKVSRLISKSIKCGTCQNMKGIVRCESCDFWGC